MVREQRTGPQPNQGQETSPSPSILFNIIILLGLLARDQPQRPNEHAAELKEEAQVGGASGHPALQDTRLTRAGHGSDSGKLASHFQCLDIFSSCPVRLMCIVGGTQSPSLLHCVIGNDDLTSIKLGTIHQDQCS